MKILVVDDVVQPILLCHLSLRRRLSLRPAGSDICRICAGSDHCGGGAPFPELHVPVMVAPEKSCWTRFIHLNQQGLAQR